MDIQFTQSIVFGKDVKDRPIRRFRANPLDVDLNIMQEKMRQRCELEVSEHGDFAPVVEKDTIHPNYQLEVAADR